MPQARLPDINTAFIVYRREAITSLKGSRYDSCFGSLYALNGLLPEKYRVTISTLEYNEKTNHDIMVICNHCKKESWYKEIKVYKLLNSVLDGILSEHEYEKVWSCPKCNQTNKLLKTRMKQQVLKEPYFLKVVPRPPERKDGLNDRTKYHKQVSRWVWTFLDELEAQMAQFRDDNWHKGDDVTDLNVDVDTGGEEVD